jgi:phosphatidate cytidylyltransferase
VPFGTLVLIHRLGGREAVLLLLFTIVVSDSAQYYTGRLFGRRPLAPAISPKKTVEGAVGGLVIGTLAVVLAGRFVFPFVRVAPLVVLGTALVALGIAGDLFESRLKRAAGLKDSSTLIPGHGGMLDRVDALLVATPAFYVFLLEVM